MSKYQQMLQMLQQRQMQQKQEPQEQEPQDQEYEEDYPEDMDYGQQTPAMPPPQAIQPQQQQPYNPYYNGIRNAIAEARESMGATREQEHRSLRQALAAAANSYNNQSAGNNFHQFANALNAGVGAYDTSENTHEQNNEALADKMIRQKFAEERAAEQQQNIEADRDLRRQAMEQQHQMQQQSLMQRFQENAMRRQIEEQGMQLPAEPTLSKEDISNNSLMNIIEDAKKAITNSGDKGQYGRLEQFGNNWLPGGINKNSNQAEIDTIGDILRGKLFNIWGYKNQAEFEHVPSISSANSPEVNLAILDSLQQMITREQNNFGDKEVLMIDPETGERDYVPRSRVEEAMADGLVINE